MPAFGSHQPGCLIIVKRCVIVCCRSVGDIQTYRHTRHAVEFIKTVSGLRFSCTFVVLKINCKTAANLQGGPKKRGHRHMTIILSILDRFKNFFTARFLGKFVPHLAYVATLPCETLMSAKQAINDILQGSVATRLRCGGVVNNQIKKGLLLSPRVNKKI